MEENSQYDELLVRYLFNEETAEEKVFVENWLNASEENMRYFNRLKTTWQLTEVRNHLPQLADEANLDKKWNRLEQDIAERQKGKPVISSILMASAVAASILLVIGLGWFWISHSKPDMPVVQHREKENLEAKVHHEVNTTGKERSVQLADGSLVVLGVNSEVAYRVPFTDKREIILIGKAYFKVAPDKKKPFTVKSGDVSTTVLSTAFSVTAYKPTSPVIIRLYEGKVVISAADKGNKWWKKDIYLLPGQEFVYRGQDDITVRSFLHNDDAASDRTIHEELAKDSPSVPETQDRPYFMFNNELLGAVLEDLSALYQVKIHYRKKDVQNIYFTRKYNRSDSLEVILREIATIHHLTISKKDDAYTISR